MDNMKFISIVALELITQIYIMCHSKAVPIERNLIGIDEKDGAGCRFRPRPSMNRKSIFIRMQRSILHYCKQLLSNGGPVLELLKGLFHVLTVCRGGYCSSLILWMLWLMITATLSAFIVMTAVRVRAACGRPSTSVKN